MPRCDLESAAYCRSDFDQSPSGLMSANGVRVSDAGPVRAVDTLRGRRPKASDERTRGKARGVGGLWGFGRTAALAEDGFAQIAESARPPKMADWVVPRRAQTARPSCAVEDQSRATH